MEAIEDEEFMGKIVWLASYPKSGNTWMRTFIHNLMRNPNQAYDINKINDLSTGDSVVHWYQRVSKKPIADWSQQEVADARGAVQRLISVSRPDNVFVKTHNAMVEYLGKPLIHMEWTAGAIYIVRNPLDVCISLADHYGVDIDEAIRAMGDDRTATQGSDKVVYEIHTSWSHHCLSWTRNPHPGLHMVRYEDMLDQPEKAFGGVCKFLGLKPPASRLAQAIEQSSFKNLKSQEAEKGFLERSVNSLSKSFFRVGKAGQWREVLNQSQIDRIVERHGEQMKRFGYLPL